MCECLKCGHPPLGCTCDEAEKRELPVDKMVILPDGANEIRFRQWERQENPFKNIKQKMMWLCQIADTCPLDGTWDRQTDGYGETQAEAYNDAIKNWKAI